MGCAKPSRATTPWPAAAPTPMGCIACGGSMGCGGPIRWAAATACAAGSCGGALGCGDPWLRQASHAPSRPGGRRQSGAVYGLRRPEQTSRRWDGRVVGRWPGQLVGRPVARSGKGRPFGCKGGLPGMRSVKRPVCMAVTQAIGYSVGRPGSIGVLRIRATPPQLTHGARRRHARRRDCDYADRAGTTPALPRLHHTPPIPRTTVAHMRAAPLGPSGPCATACALIPRRLAAEGPIKSPASGQPKASAAPCESSSSSRQSQIKSCARGTAGHEHLFAVSLARHAVWNASLKTPHTQQNPSPTSVRVLRSPSIGDLVATESPSTLSGDKHTNESNTSASLGGQTQERCVRCLGMSTRRRTSNRVNHAGSDTDVELACRKWVWGRRTNRTTQHSPARLLKKLHVSNATEIGMSFNSEAARLRPRVLTPATCVAACGACHKSCAPLATRRKSVVGAGGRGMAEDPASGNPTVASKSPVELDGGSPCCFG